MTIFFIFFRCHRFFALCFQAIFSSFSARCLVFIVFFSIFFLFLFFAYFSEHLVSFHFWWPLRRFRYTFNVFSGLPGAVFLCLLYKAACFSSLHCYISLVCVSMKCSVFLSSCSFSSWFLSCFSLLSYRMIASLSRRGWQKPFLMNRREPNRE